MRNIIISIGKRIDSDNSYTFSPFPNETYNPNSPYEFVEALLNYSLVDSNITSMLILSVNQLIGTDNILRTGQPIIIMENGQTVFQGVLLACKYKVMPIGGDDQGGVYLIATLAPSLYQLTITPMVFNSDQAQQISSILNTDINSILAGGIAQDIDTNTLLDYMISNTDYSNIFNRTINFSDLGTQVFVMAQSGQSRDSILRQSINYYNCVLYQDESGQININQLSANYGNNAPFTLDLQNGAESISSDISILHPIVPMLQYEYTDNAYSTPAMVSTYAILNANIAIAADVTDLLITYAPNSQFFPRLQQLQQGGWFTGIIDNIQINQNIVQDPTTASALNQYAAAPDQYMNSIIGNGAKNPTIGAYQALLTGKELGNALTGYASLSGTISLDDKNLVNIDMQMILGTIVQINNCDLKSGIIATCSRSYSALGSYLSFNIAPLGSLTGYWAES